jgi:hypothetical protein
VLKSSASDVHGAIQKPYKANDDLQLAEPISLEKPAPIMTLSTTEEHTLMIWIALRQRNCDCPSAAKFETKHRFFSEPEQEQRGSSASTGGAVSDAIMRARPISLHARHRNLLEMLSLAATSTFISRLSCLPCPVASLRGKF